VVDGPGTIERDEFQTIRQNRRPDLLVTAAKTANFAKRGVSTASPAAKMLANSKR
jgi:hypothetical protein